MSDGRPAPRRLGIRLLALIALLLQLLPLQAAARPTHAVLNDHGILVLAGADICHPGTLPPAGPTTQPDCCHGLPCLMGAALLPTAPSARPAALFQGIVLVKSAQAPVQPARARRPYASRAPPRIG